MLKKSSSILQELGLDKQVRTETRAALRSQASRSLQEAPRPLGRPLVVASAEASCPGAKASDATAVESDNAVPSLPSPQPTLAEVSKADAKTSESRPTEVPTAAPSSISSSAVPVEQKKVEPRVTAPQVSRPVEGMRHPSTASEAKVEPSLAAPQVSRPVEGMRHPSTASEAKVEPTVAATQVSRPLEGMRQPVASEANPVETADVGRRRPPALGGPVLRPVAQAPAISEAPLTRPVLKPSAIGVAPPKPSGSATPVVERSVVPKEVAGLRWPPCFLEDPHGGRVELTEGAARATRESGVGRGMCFLGPLQPAATGGSVYFEIEVLELEAQRSQTIALGFSTSLPAARPLLAERATDLGHGCFLVGYDLPKLFVHGETAAKISARDWRPLKEICCGDCVGLLAARSASGGLDLTVYVNGHKKVSVPLPGVDESAAVANALPWPGVEACSDLYGVVDIHGAVRSVRLRRPPAGPLPPSVSLHRSPVPRPLSTNSPPPTQGCVTPQQAPARGTLRALDRSTCAEADAPARKRSRLATFPDCNCTAHLRRSNADVVHITSADFCIGRDTKVVNLALESEDAPNMVSRTHARIVSNDAGVQVIDCRSLNGTWLNSVKVANQLLRTGDTLVIGNPTQGPPEFRFTVELPSN